MLQETLLSLGLDFLISVLGRRYGFYEGQEPSLPLAFLACGKSAGSKRRCELAEGQVWRRGGAALLGKAHPLSFTALKGDRGFAAGHWVLCGLLLGQAHPLYTEPPWKGLWGRPTAGSVAAVPRASQLFKHPWK